MGVPFEQMAAATPGHVVAVVTKAAEGNESGAAPLVIQAEAIPAMIAPMAVISTPLNVENPISNVLRKS
jgi:hypothetical protein